MLFLIFQWWGFLFFLLRVYQRSRPLPRDIRKLALDLAILMELGWLLGGRIFHVLFENPEFYWKQPLAILDLTPGGFALVGGMIGGALLTFERLRRSSGPNWWSWMDWLTPLFSPLYIWGRLGCFLEGCCYGHFCDLPWAVGGRHPTQLYAILGEGVVWIWVLSSRKLLGAYFSGYLFLIWLMGHSFLRLLFMEPFRADERGPLWLGQWSLSSGLLALLGLAALIIYHWRKKAFFERKISASELMLLEAKN